jgi:hypothetical protein
MMNGESIVLKHKAQRIKYKDGIAFGDEYVNCLKIRGNSLRIHPRRGFLLYSLCFMLCALNYNALTIHHFI